MKLATFLLLSVCAAAPATEPGWPAWRGPSMDGTHPAVAVFDEGFGLELAWSRELGPGYSGIAVAGGVAATMFSHGESDVLVALDTGSGEERWRLPFATTRRGESGSADGPLGSPAIADGVVYALGPEGHLVAARLDDGKKLWSRRIEDEPWQHGFAGTPLVSGRRLIVQADAYDARTGVPLWSHGDEPVHYQSPVRLTLAGRPQLLVTTTRHVFSLDEDGSESWRHPHVREVADGHTQLVPVGESGLLIHYLNGSLLYDLKSDGLVERWRSAALRSSLCPPLHHDGTLFGFSGESLVAIEAATGKALWTAEELAARGGIVVDGHLLLLTPEGELVVAPATAAGFTEKARIETAIKDSYTWPSFAGRQVFLRDLKRVVAVRIVPAKRSSSE